MVSVLARTYQATNQGIRNAVKDIAEDLQFYREKHRDGLHRNLVIALHSDDWMFLEYYVKNWEKIKWS